MIIPNALPGQLGLIVDQEPAELSPGAWTDVKNVRFQNGAAKAMRKDVPVATAPEGLEWALPLIDTNTTGASWVLTSDTKAYAMQGQLVEEITPTGVTGVGANYRTWTGGVLGGLPIINNGQQAPWVWTSRNTATPMEVLANWPSGMLAKSLRVYKQYLVALNVQKGVDRYPQMVKWSHPADAGNVPITWDEADPTRDAGEYLLSETPGELVDCAPLKDIMVLYKSDSVWGMQWIGGVYIFRFWKLFGEFGIANKDCAVEYATGKHFVFTGNDAVIHDGNIFKSVSTGKVRKFFRSLTGNQVQSTFVTAFTAQNEVWLCLRRADDGNFQADTALVWNYLDETWSLRVLPEVSFISPGNVEPPQTVDNSWGDQSGSWSAADLVWGEYSPTPAMRRLLGVGSQILWMDGSERGMDSAMLEREAVGVPMRANTPPDLSTMKFVTHIWPRFKGVQGLKLRMTFGVADQVAQGTNWKAVRTFTIGSTKKINLTLSGKLFSMRIEVDPENTVEGGWSYHGLDMEILPAGVN